MFSIATKIFKNFYITDKEKCYIYNINKDILHIILSYLNLYEIMQMRTLSKFFCKNIKKIDLKNEEIKTLQMLLEKLTIHVEFKTKNIKFNFFSNENFGLCLNLILNDETSLVIHFTCFKFNIFIKRVNGLMIKNMNQLLLSNEFIISANTKEMDLIDKNIYFDYFLYYNLKEILSTKLVEDIIYYISQLTLISYDNP
jgi:hypothetical protein